MEYFLELTGGGVHVSVAVRGVSETEASIALGNLTDGVKGAISRAPYVGCEAELVKVGAMKELKVTALPGAPPEPKKKRGGLSGVFSSRNA